MILAQTLRDTILQAAMQGKLTEQLSSDSSADDMFRLIEEEKANGIKSKKIKRDNSCSIKKYNPLEDGIFEIPSSWRWVKLGELCQKIGAGSTPSGGSKVYVSEGVKFLREQNVRNEGISYEGIVYIPKEIHSLMDGSKVMAKDILLNITGASIGRNSLVPDDFDTANVNQHVLVIRFIDERLRLYIHLCLQAPFVYNQMMAEQKGDKPGLSATRVSNFLIPLPPIEEQQRIVDRVNELLAKVDEFEKIENRLTAVKEKFPLDLRAAILQAAMQGKLTEQLDTDGSVDELLSRIEIEKKQSNKKGNSPHINPILDEDIPYDIPSSWRWVRFGNLVDFSMGKTPARSESSYWDADYPWVSISDMPENGIVDSTAEKISYFAFNSVFKGNFSPAGTLLMSFKLTVGRVSYLGIDAVHNEAIISIFPLCDIEDTIKHYLFKILPFISKYGDTKDAIKGKTLNKTSIANLLIPFPPIEEQQRIVERLDALLPLCDELTEE